MKFKKPILSLVLSGGLMTVPVIMATPSAYASTSTNQSNSQGLIVISPAGTVVGVNGAQTFGSVEGSHTVVAAAATPQGGGYWIVTKSGHVYAFGDAKYYGDTYTDGITGLSGARPLNGPIVGIVADPEGTGYWLFAADGGVFNFGSAPFLGSTYDLGITGLKGSKPLTAPVVGALSSTSGHEFSLVTADGTEYQFGTPQNGSVVANVQYVQATGSLPAQITEVTNNPYGPGGYAVLGNGQVFSVAGAPSVPNVPVGQQHKAFIIPTPHPLKTIIPPLQPVVPPNPGLGGGGGQQPPQGPTITIDDAEIQLLPNQSVQLKAIGGASTYTWTAQSLPSWLSLSSSGALTSNIANLGDELPDAFINVSASGDGGSGSATINVVLEPPPLENATLNASGSSGSYTADGQLSVSSQYGTGYTFVTVHKAPAALSISPSGQISGTVPGVEPDIQVLVMDPSGAHALGQDTLAIYTEEQFQIPSASTVTIYPGQSIQLTSSYGTGTWAASSLPSWLSLSSSGVLTSNIANLGSQAPYATPEIQVVGSSFGISAPINVVLQPPPLESSTFAVNDDDTSYVVNSQLSISSQYGTGYTFAKTDEDPSTLFISPSGQISGTVPASSPDVHVLIMNAIGEEIGQETEALYPDVFAVVPFANAIPISPRQSIQLEGLIGKSYVWSTSSSLPSWLSLSSSGVLTSNIANLGSQEPDTVLQMREVNAATGVTVQTFPITVNMQPPPLESSTFLASTGSSGPYVVSGQITTSSRYGSGYTLMATASDPSTLTISSGGQISGSVPEAESDIQVLVMDPSGAHALGYETIVIDPTLQIDASSVPVQIYPGLPVPIEASGGIGTYQWTMENSQSGPVSLSSSGVLSTTSAFTSPYVSPFGVLFIVTSGVQQSYAVSPLAFQVPSLVNTQFTENLNEPFQIQLAVPSSQGTGYTFSSASGNGLSVSSSGLLSGELTSSTPDAMIAVNLDYNGAPLANYDITVGS
ncbi:hypothetical protein [Ferrimicrobium sp.]|uniref:hypothetical protein n=1 Tax=Ferrimicrobium sp. TaxID=2926050 RepID=UPI0026284D94|nr:hypothetical protein [Ferrimicrobium sp.]